MAQGSSLLCRQPCVDSASVTTTSRPAAEEKPHGKQADSRQLEQLPDLDYIIAVDPVDLEHVKRIIREEIHEGERPLDAGTKRLAETALMIAVAVLVLSVTLYVFGAKFDLLGQTGDFVGGWFNPALTFVTIVLLLQDRKEQRDRHQKQLDEEQRRHREQLDAEQKRHQELLDAEQKRHQAQSEAARMHHQEQMGVAREDLRNVREIADSAPLLQLSGDLKMALRGMQGVNDLASKAEAVKICRRLKDFTASGRMTAVQHRIFIDICDTPEYKRVDHPESHAFRRALDAWQEDQDSATRIQNVIDAEARGTARSSGSAVPEVVDATEEDQQKVGD